MKHALISLCASAIALACVAGCSSEAGSPSEHEVDTASLPAPEGDPQLSDTTVVDPSNPACYYTYSDVVAAYIDYASVHCEGWTGKVFCEYSSLSSTYGPGWGTCQCYNYKCNSDVPVTHKRYRCYAGRCR